MLLIQAQSVLECRRYKWVAQLKLLIIVIVVLFYTTTRNVIHFFLLANRQTVRFSHIGLLITE